MEAFRGARGCVCKVHSRFCFPKVLGTGQPAPRGSLSGCALRKAFLLPYWKIYFPIPQKHQNQKRGGTKTMKKRILAAVIAAVFAVLNVASAMPALAFVETTPKYAPPAGYNGHDYQKLVAFLEQTDESGIKNGDKLSNNYDPMNPETWGEDCFEWTTTVLKLRIYKVNISCMDCCGEIDVSGCSELENFDCHGNSITKVDLSGCIALKGLNCEHNGLTELDVSDCRMLDSLCCAYNGLSNLDLVNNTVLESLYCSYNKLTELDVRCCNLDEHFICTNNEELKEIRRTSSWPDQYGNYEHTIIAEGGGSLGFYYDGWDNEAFAKPDEGCSFIGWYSETGELIASAENCYGDWNYYEEGAYSTYGLNIHRNLIAKFTEVEPIPGDADGDGQLTSNDALSVMRTTLGIGGVSNPESCDMNGDGIINLTDSLLILRAALGLQQSQTALNSSIDD